MMNEKGKVWTDTEKDSLADTVTSYVNGLMMAINQFEVEQDEIEDVLLTMNIECCPNCGWYVESMFLLPDGEDYPDGYCNNCRDDKREKEEAVKGE